VQDEFPGYVWASTQKEQPVKEKDDGLDMTRYVVAYVDGLDGRQFKTVYDDTIKVRMGY
jgi:hypothetical protein